MTYKEVIEAINYSFQPNRKQIKTIFIKGKPGIGKTSIAYHLKALYERQTNSPWIVIKRRLSDLFAEDFSGLPKIDEKNGVTRWYPPEFLPLKGVKKFEGTQGILLLDEINKAKPDVLQAVMKVLDRDGFLDNWLVIATGNLGEADGTFIEQLDTAQARRFLILELNYSFGDWKEWATEFKIDNRIIEFLSNFPQYGYFEYINKKGKKCYVTLAHWEEMDSYIKNNENEMSIIEIVQTVGFPLLGDVAIPFLSFLQREEMITVQDLYHFDNPVILEKIINIERSDLYRVLKSFIELMKEKSTKDFSAGDFNVVKNLIKLKKDNGKPLLDDDTYLAFLKELLDKVPRFYALLNINFPKLFERATNLWIKT